MATVTLQTTKEQPSSGGCQRSLAPLCRQRLFCGGMGVETCLNHWAPPDWDPDDEGLEEWMGRLLNIDLLQLRQMVEEQASTEKLAAQARAKNHGVRVCLIPPSVGAWMLGVEMSWLVVKQCFQATPWFLWVTPTQALRLAQQLLCDIGRACVLLLRVFLPSWRWS